MCGASPVHNALVCPQQALALHGHISQRPDAPGLIQLSMVGSSMKWVTWRAGMFEAGTFPAMWAHLTRFYAGGPHLAAAWGFIGAAQPFAQACASCPCSHHCVAYTGQKGFCVGQDGHTTAP